MSDQVLEVVYDARPPLPFAGEEDRLRSGVAEFNDRMARWMSSEPMTAGELGVPRRVAWEPKELPPAPDEVEQRSLGAVAGGSCPECSQEKLTGAAVHRLDHQCVRAEWELKERYRPKFTRVRRTVRNPVSGRPEQREVWLKWGVP